jgi:hypothetical protein
VSEAMVHDEIKQIDNLLYYGGEHVSEAYEAAIAGVRYNDTTRYNVKSSDRQIRQNFQS